MVNVGFTNWIDMVLGSQSLANRSATRIGPHRGDIAETDDSIGRVTLEVGQHRLQRHPVAMNIGNEGNAHQAVSIVSRGISTPGTSIPTAAAPSIRIG